MDKSKKLVFDRYIYKPLLIISLFVSMIIGFILLASHLFFYDTYTIKMLAYSTILLIFSLAFFVYIIAEKKDYFFVIYFALPTILLYIFLLPIMELEHSTDNQSIKIVDDTILYRGNIMTSGIFDMLTLTRECIVKNPSKVTIQSRGGSNEYVPLLSYMFKFCGAKSIEVDKNCGSACTPVYFSFNKRSMDNATLSFHTSSYIVSEKPYDDVIRIWYKDHLHPEAIQYISDNGAKECKLNQAQISEASPDNINFNYEKMSLFCNSR